MENVYICQIEVSREETNLLNQPIAIGSGSTDLLDKFCRLR